MKYLSLTILLIAFVFSNNLSAQSFSADAFLPPAQAETDVQAEELLAVQEPDAVKTETGVITGQPAVVAATPQDAINAYLEQDHTSGFAEFRFPSGLGFIATGAGFYKKHDNPTTTRIEQRNAYNKAFMEAKKNLTEGFYGLSNDGKTALAQSMSNIDTSSGGTLTNTADLTDEAIRQSVEGLIRGFVVYHVKDDIDNSTVVVSIVSTPKTRGLLERPDNSSIIADSVRDGLNSVIAEAKNGLVPPIGGKTIFVPATGELAYIGFGSAVVRFDNDPALQARHRVNAERIASARAKDSLCGIIIGDTITSSSQIDSQMIDIIKDYNEISADDPLNSPNDGSSGYQALTERKKEFLSQESNSLTITSIREGNLPPGLNAQTWLDKDKTFAYAMAVYLPSASNNAAAARDRMMQGTIVQNHGPSSGGTAQAPNQRPVPSAPPATAGPSGTVQSYDAL
jgi:hypothetical protein